MKAFREIGFAKAFKFVGYLCLYLFYRALPLPQLRVLFLRVMGAKIGRDCVIHNARFFNFYRTGFSGLTLGDECFIGDETLLDLASPITLENQVTLAERVTVLTHLNVGYADHPLQKAFPATARPVTIRRGSFVGACATILDGVELGPETFVAAGALVRESSAGRKVLAGVPARELRDI